MVALTVVAALLAAEPGALKVATAGLNVVNIDAAEGEFYSEHVAQQLKFAGLEVVTAREIQALLGMERQRVLLGCNESDSCMTELANALGVDSTLLGGVAKLDGRFQVNLKLISATNGKTLAVFSDTVSSSAAVIEALTRGAEQLAIDASREMGRPLKPLARPLSVVPGVVLLAVGAVAAGAGVAGLVSSENAYQQLKSGTPGADGATLKTTGQTTGTLGIVGVAVGGAALAAGAALLVVSAVTQPASATKAGPKVSAWFSPGAGGLVVGGSF